MWLTAAATTAAAAAAAAVYEWTSFATALSTFSRELL